MVECVPFSSMLRQRNALAIAFTIALSMRPPSTGRLSGAPSGAITSFRPPRLRIEIGILTVIVRPSLLTFGETVMRPSGILIWLRAGPLPDCSVLRGGGEYPNRRD